MRILHLSTLYPPHVVGGAERSVELLAESQLALGHTVAAACIERQAEPPEVRNGVSVYRMAHNNLFWLEDWPQHMRFSRTWQKLAQQWNFGIAEQFGAVIDHFKPDVVHTHSMVDISTLVWRAANRRNVPIVHTLRDYDMMCGNAAMFRRGKPCEKWHLNCKAVTFTKGINARLVSGLAGVGAEIIKTHVDAGLFGHLQPSMRRPIWNAAVVEGSDAAKRRLIERSGPMTFGYLGRINEEKGINTLIDAFRMLPRDDYRVVIAGKAMDSLDPFVARAEGLPITFAGWMAAKDLFEAIDVLIVPSFWAEPLPRTILESYAMGVPVIGAKSGGIPELVGYDNHDWLFEPGNHTALAERIGRVLAGGRDSLPGSEAFDHVLKETKPEIVAQKYVQFYQDVRDARDAARARRAV